MLKWRQTSIRLASSFTVRSFGICGSVGPPGAAPIEVRVLHFSKPAITLRFVFSGICLCGEYLVHWIWLAPHSSVSSEHHSLFFM